MFKKNQKVYCGLFDAFGVVSRTDFEYGIRFVHVKFDFAIIVYKDGAIHIGAKPTLSTVKYTLKIDGRSEMPIGQTGVFSDPSMETVDGIFGILKATYSDGSFCCERGHLWSKFEPMSLEEYAKLKKIDLA